MNTWKERLKNTLEPVLSAADPRAKLGAYHDMPYAIFHYTPDVEFELREEVRLLSIRLGNIGKRVKIISLAECLTAALAAEGSIHQLASQQLMLLAEGINLLRTNNQ